MAIIYVMQNRRSFHEEFYKRSEELFPDDYDGCYLLCNEICQNSARRHEERKTGCLNALWKSLGMGMCFVYETPKAKMISEYIVKDRDSKKDRSYLQPDEKKSSRKNKIIYWDEPRIQNRINKSVYFNTG